MNESALKEKIAAWLRSRGFFYQRFAGSAFVRSGVPDFFVMLPTGRACWIEVKAPGRYAEGHVWDGCKKDSPGQYEFMRRVGLACGLPLIVDSLEEVIAALDEYADLMPRGAR